MQLSTRTPNPARRLAVLVPVVGLLAAGCGGGGDGGGSGGGSGGEATATDAAQPCFEGETATFAVPYPPGGGYDTVARALAPALEDELGATVVVENQPGAGGLSAANTLAQAAPDSSTFAILPSVGILAATLAGVDGVNFDPLDFTFIARVTPDERLMVTSPKTGLGTIQDVLDADRQIEFAATGPGGGDYIDATIVSQILGLDAKVVSGYPGSGDTALAVSSGDVDAVFSSVAGLLSGVESNDLVPVMVAGKERAQDLPDVPAMLELDLDEQHRALAEAHAQLQQAGRAILAPPGMEQSCADELASAFEAAVQNQTVLDTLEPAHEHVSYLGGAELSDIYRSVLEDSPDEYLSLVKDAFAGQ